MRRSLTSYIIDKHNASKHRACKLAGLSRSVYAYKRKPLDDAAIISILKQLAHKHKRYGFRKLFCKIKKIGFVWNHKRVYRVYCALGLNLRKKPKKRLPRREKVVLEQPKHCNHTWSLDYMSDMLTSGQRFRTVNVIDDHNREALAIKADRSLPSIQIISTLDEIAFTRGYPQKIRMDNGPENISKAMKQWAAERNIELQYIQPGKPAQNGYIERFNRTYREEVLDMYLFKSIQEVQRITNKWMQEYNQERPHYSLGNKPPVEYAKNQNILFLRCTKNGG